MKETLLQITGGLLIPLALLHIGFPRYFQWKQDLRPLSLINRQMMEVHTFFVALTVLLMGVLCLLSPSDLSNTPLGRQISLGLAIFWGVRLVIQFVWYSPRLWRGKTFETIVHVLFSLLWIGLTALFLWVGLPL